MGESILATQNLSVFLNTRRILKNITIAINPGDFIGLTGPNGGGKSTLIKTALGLVPYVEGKISLWGKNRKKFQEHHKIGYLPQKNSNLNQLMPANVEEVITTGITSKQLFLSKKIRQNKITNILDKLKINHLKERMYSELSGGEQQKTLLARALINTPTFLILDEPSTALDVEKKKDFFLLLKELHEVQKTTILLVSHDTEYIQRYVSKVLHLNEQVDYFGNVKNYRAWLKKEPSTKH